MLQWMAEPLRLQRAPERMPIPSPRLQWVPLRSQAQPPKRMLEPIPLRSQAQTPVRTPQPILLASQEPPRMWTLQLVHQQWPHPFATLPPGC
jgi:hypothetical protein